MNAKLKMSSLDLESSMNGDTTYIIQSLADSSNCVIDSIPRDDARMCEITIADKEEEHNFFSTDLFANIVSAGALLITLIIFIIQTKQARKEQRRTIKENWYLTIILQPNMEELEKFYAEEANQLEVQINKLKGRHGKETTEKAKSIKQLRDLKNEFFNHFILMIQGYDIKIAQDAEDILNELADLNSHCIDHYKRVSIVDSKREVFENKAKLINALYKGISNEA